MEVTRFRMPLKQTLRRSVIPPLAFLRRSPVAARALYKQQLPPPPLPHPPPPRFMSRTLDSMSYLNFDDHPRFDADEPMLFEFDSEFSSYPSYISPGYDSAGDFMDDIKPVIPPSPAYELSSSPSYSSDGLYNPEHIYRGSPLRLENLYLNNWSANDTDESSLPSPSSPIPIPSGPQSPSFVAFSDGSPFGPQSFSPQSFSPAAFAAALPLPGSHSPSSSFDDHYAVPNQQIDSVSPHETQTPAWAAQLWESTGSRHLRTSSSPRSIARHSPLSDSHRARRNSLSSGQQLFPSTSAPSVAPMGQNTVRSYSTRRAESFGASDDRDATVRRKKRIPGPEESEGPDKAHESPPQKSMLRPPKLAPSAWQLYFTDWIQRQQASSTRKLNVAQAAKEAGQEYASLSEDEKEPYKRRSQAAKDIRERELNAYMRTLTPEDIKRENAFRSAQRKAGKSRKSNIKDPNAPKKPLSAYFMFLQRIRANPELVREIFGDETETTKQSVLAAAKWRSMTDDERKPFLAQAEQEKMEYETARRLYEDGTVGYASSINFSILPGSPAFPVIKLESESESEGFATDDGPYHHVRSHS
ncbi:hypothetical protein FB45DRAFT_904795 [Roridomyces roridus]|uniref:HMG box domain-containing protein n=1 Tax=Roridomyces roridus TaxID=1738132 RepID=A0AAD7C559_9AGAR|nr:hypothetical protein FB45DRAFT_904795 [Roridomyces roridus]